MEGKLSPTDRSSSRAARITESAGLRSTRSVPRTSSSTGIFLMPSNHCRHRPSHTREPRAASNPDMLASWFLWPTKVLTGHTLAHLLRDYQSQRAQDRVITNLPFRTIAMAPGDSRIRHSYTGVVGAQARRSRDGTRSARRNFCTNHSRPDETGNAARRKGARFDGHAALQHHKNKQAAAGDRWFRRCDARRKGRYRPLPEDGSQAPRRPRLVSPRKGPYLPDASLGRLLRSLRAGGQEDPRDPGG